MNYHKPGNLIVENQFDNQPLPIEKYEYAQPKSFSGGNGTYHIDNPFGVDAEVMIGVIGSTDAGANIVVTYDYDPLANIPLLAPQGLIGNQFKGQFPPLVLPNIFIPVKQYLVMNVTGIGAGAIFATFYFRRHAIMFLPDDKRKPFSDPSM